MKRIVLAVLLLSLAACAEQRYLIDSALHPGNPKVLTFTAEAGEITSVSWKRYCDVADCSMYATHVGSDKSMAPAPRACYVRWWQECDGKLCREGWWEKCAEQEAAKVAGKVRAQP